MNKICVFGATGQTGLEVIRELNNRNCNINAFVRNPKKIPDNLKTSKLNIFQGDILNYDDVLRAIANCDAVISIIGHGKNTPPDMQTRGIENIIKAMNSNHITRIISLTGTGVRQPNDKISAIDRIANFMIGKIDPDRIADGINHAKKLEESDIDWTIIRVLKLSNKKHRKQNYNLTKNGPAEITTSREKVAKIIIDLIENHKFIKEMPVVSK